MTADCGRVRHWIVNDNDGETSTERLATAVQLGRERGTVGEPVKHDTIASRVGDAARND